MSEDVWLLIVAVIPLYTAVALSIYEVAQRRDLAHGRKVVWIVVLLFLPPIGLALYVVARPPRHRAAVADSAPGAERAEQIVDLVERHSLGDLDDASYESALAALAGGGQNS